MKINSFELNALVFTLVNLFCFGCNQNLMGDLASKTSDDYFYEEATKANNAQNYDGAIIIITEKMSARYQGYAKAKELLASAYAGKCGLNFLNYVDSLSKTTATAPFLFMMTPFVGVSTDVNYCKLAISTMESIGASAYRTSGQNMFVAILGLSLMGTGLRQNADKTPALGDGTADVNLCTTVTDSQIEDVIIGFGYFTLNIGFVSASLIGSGSLSALTNLNSVCTTQAGVSCTVTDPSGLSAPTRTALGAFFRRLLNTSQYGIGTYDIAGDDTKIALACP